MGASPVLPTPSDTSSWAEVASCPHPYFPLEEGLKLTYRMGRSELTLSTRDVKSGPEGLRGILAVDLKGRHGEAEATCDAEGIRTGLGGLEGTLLSATGMEVEVLASEGVIVPPVARMRPGQAWRNSLSVRLQPPRTATLRAIISTTFDREATVVGEEEVRVEGGTFQALKVRNTTTARSSRQGSGRSIESFIWFAPGVGIVKVETAGKADLELLRLERPVEARKKAPARKGRPRG